MLTDRGRPIAVIKPIKDEGGGQVVALRAMAEEGLIGHYVSRWHSSERRLTGFESARLIAEKHIDVTRNASDT